MFKLSMVVSIKEAVFESIALKGRLEDCIRKAYTMGYEGVELSFPNPWKVDIRHLKRILADYDLEVPALSTGLSYLHYKWSLTSTDSSLRSKAIEALEKYIELAEPLNALVVIGLIRGECKDIPADKAFNTLEQSLRECCRAAESRGVTLVLEPLNRYETRLINRVEEALKMVHRVSSDNLRLLVDTFHMNIEEPIIEESLRLAGKLIAHVHVADSNRLAPGMGHLDFKSILSVLKDIGYKNYLSAEILPIPDPDTATRATIEYLRKIMACL